MLMGGIGIPVKILGRIRIQRVSPAAIQIMLIAAAFSPSASAQDDPYRAAGFPDKRPSIQRGDVEVYSELQVGDAPPQKKSERLFVTIISTPLHIENGALHVAHEINRYPLEAAMWSDAKLREIPPVSKGVVMQAYQLAGERRGLLDAESGSLLPLLPPVQIPLLFSHQMIPGAKITLPSSVPNTASPNMPPWKAEYTVVFPEDLSGVAVIQCLHRSGPSERVEDGKRMELSLNAEETIRYVINENKIQSRSGKQTLRIAAKGEMERSETVTFSFEEGK